MATTTLFVLLALVLIHAALTLPVSQDRKSVPSSDITQDDEPTRSSAVGDLDTMKSVNEDTEESKNLDSVPFDGALKRTKRYFVTGNHNCAEGMEWFDELNRCETRERYQQLKEDEYDES